MHHLTGQGDFTTFMGSEPWPDGVSELTAQTALPVGILLLLAAAGKSGLVPFSGWLPRAMEGPTPSSAIFYGALSVHLGAYLLLRTSPILESSMILRSLVIALGLVSAVCGAMMSRVQSDIKSCLAYASLTQVGIIVVEIGVGFYYLALIHIFGHACLRTLQLLRAPMLLTDYHALENAMGQQLTNQRSFFARFIPLSFRNAAFRFAYERGFMDLVLDRYFVAPFVAIFEWSDRQERRWTDWISGSASRESDRIELHPEDTDRNAVLDSHDLPLATGVAGSLVQHAASDYQRAGASRSLDGRDV
jgi:NAD(P)H-quinone oxidoreductase subunit 5